MKKIFEILLTVFGSFVFYIFTGDGSEALMLMIIVLFLQSRDILKNQKV